MVGVQTRRADHVNDSRLRGERGEPDSRLGRGEIENSVRARDGCESVAADWDTHLAAAGEQTGVLADRDGTRLFYRTREVGARRLPNDLDEDAAKIFQAIITAMQEQQAREAEKNAPATPTA